MRRDDSGDSYSMSGLHDRGKGIMSLLLLTKPENFGRRRREIIFEALDLPANKTKKAVVEEYFLRLGAKKRNGAKALDVPDDMATRFLNAEISPYEVVGILKNINKKRLPPEYMRDIWAKLSVIDGMHCLDDRDNQSLGIDWEKEIEQSSRIPKLEALANSLEVRVGATGSKFVENYSHLKSSSGTRTNWAEVVTSLSPRDGFLVKSLLNSSKDSLDKVKVVEGYLWPAHGGRDLENRRLNGFLNSLGNRPTGRRKRYERMMLNLEPEITTPDLPEVSISALTPSEEEKAKALISKFEGSKKSAATELKPSVQIRILGTLKKTNFPQAQELWKKMETLMPPAYSLGHLEYKLHRGLPLNQSHLIETIKGVVEEVVSFKESGDSDSTKSDPKSFYSAIASLFGVEAAAKSPSLGAAIASSAASKRAKVALSKELAIVAKVALSKELIMGLLDQVEDREAFVEKCFKGASLEGVCAINQWVNKCLYQQWKPVRSLDASPVLLTEGRTVEMLDALRNGEYFDFTKSYGDRGISPLHISAVVGSAYEFEALCDFYTNKGFNLSPLSNKKMTPLDLASVQNARVLLDRCAHLDIEDVEGKRGDQSLGSMNYWHENRLAIPKHLSMYETKKAVRKSLKAEAPEEIFEP